MIVKKILYAQKAIDASLSQMADDILSRFPQPPVLVGIRRGGLVICDRLGQLLSHRGGNPVPIGVVDINLYRDDWTMARSFPKVGRTEICFGLDDRRVVLVDDVLYTGRTVRAALEALTEFGRPRRIELAILVDRGRREMPIQPDYVGLTMETSAEEMVEVRFSEAANGDEIVLLGPK
ncbi:MAG: bifunctional pyr operon transcriptional regulator/uracil phosphoribosyltransferase PyrR [Deltaproteobacteria bacterium]|jgi:pyrimidine operon attenuation protein/uracil phosphoribosyltransferase|nr:bifunctional pyr operon transcriptional regulator/uracil phosphoribosyltransferase PyrR [Deltaproteobacteria bacterium]